MNRNSNPKNTIKFILFPVVFCALALGIAYVAVEPIVGPYAKVLNVTFLDQKPVFVNGAMNIYQQKNNSAGTVSSSLLEDSTAIPLLGQSMGMLSIPSVKIDTPLLYGDDTKSLTKGAGVYSGSGLPGSGRTILVGGHVDTVFASLKQVKTGDQVIIKTNSGEYRYQITGTKIADATDKSAYNLLSSQENLILYTCERSNQLVGLTSKRYFVYAKYLSSESTKK